MPARRKATVGQTPNAQPEPSTTPPRILSQEDIMKFTIGLRLLGEARKRRYLTYLQHLRDETQPQDRKH